jgi:outer membrane protein assembly factor BamD (BamD/ComL family)
LREQPSGSLAPEAHGRLLEALQRSGDSAAARSAASDYLARYPAGPHAEFAKRLLR